MPSSPSTRAASKDKHRRAAVKVPKTLGELWASYKTTA